MKYGEIEILTVKEHFADVFTAPAYDGSYHTPIADYAEASFQKLTGDVYLNWCQVHGDFKNVVQRADFEPYPYWPELYDCCRRVLKAHVDLNTQFCGNVTCARLMGDAMALLRKRHGANVPRWWLPIMKRLRADEK